MDSKLVLGVVLALLVASASTKYVRPPPRKTLHFPWDPKPPSYPQQFVCCVYYGVCGAGFARVIEVHISLAGAKHMRITWVTSDRYSPSIVEYGTSSKNYTSIARGENTSYKYLLYRSGTIHHAVIGPLHDDTLYFYRCGREDPEFHLKTPPSQFPVTFSVRGDLGQTEWTKTTLGHIDQCKYDIHLLPGDLSYADYIQRRWDTFGELLQPLASRRPWMVTQGNHEMENIPFLKDGFLPYNSRWKMPYAESNSNSNLYYSFDVAGVHAVMLGSYTDYDKYSDQFRWLKADLSKVNRRRTPWLLVLFHMPWYNSIEAHQGEGDEMMETMEPLLHAAGVDVVFAGHVHAYERSNRVFNGRSNRCGAVHITIGDGGNKEGLAHEYKEPQPKWSVFREASFGHGEFKIMNSTHALWRWHRNDDDQRVTSDQVWIISLFGSGCLLKKNGEPGKTLMEP
ncbi:UNVERIFIED_CONTAM: Purple acid phosphatase 18 [Sesamum radiatum]|uniref:Purple acid phosphatase n=1 Tax=Sesamum radiatum TaxID=300843 RepID=A0AAW2KIQ0_SESRA